MRLIGIHIDQKNIHPFISKSLKDEWYPFCRGIAYPIQKQNVMDSLNEAMDGLYQVKSTSKVKVSISCIVGKNGSGKSSLLDLMYAIINNFAFSHLRETVKQYGVKLYAAKGVYASLFYELDGRIFEIRCKNIHTDLYADGQLVSCKGVNVRKILHDFSFIP